MQKNYILTHLRLFTLSPIFHFILALIFYILYIKYITPFVLCDVGNIELYDLKVDLTWQVNKYRSSLIEYQTYKDLQEQLNHISQPNYRNFYLENLYSNKLSETRFNIQGYLHNINVLERCIRNIEPNFQSFNYNGSCFYTYISRR